jgi:hypothetical protein
LSRLRRIVPEGETEGIAFPAAATKIGLACSMLYYIYLCKYVLIFISDNGIKGGQNTNPGNTDINNN